MLKKSASSVLASFRPSTYPSGYASALHSLRPCWTVFLSILRGRLNRFFDFAAAKTTGADPNALRLTVDQSPDWLEIWFEDPLGLVIGVTDVIAGLAAFAAEITCKGHGTLLHLVESIEDCEGKMYHRAIGLDKQV